MKEILKNILPKFIKNKYHSFVLDKVKQQVNSLPPLDEIAFENILVKELGINPGDNLFIHASIDRLNLTFPFFSVFSIIRKVVGDQATIAFPTYPPMSSYRFLKSGEVFNIKKSPSYTGILSEFARRQKSAVRSLHPSKSVTALGPLAEEWTKEHHLSPYPYDYNSPYYKICDHNTKIIGLGVRSTYLSAVHAPDDTLRDTFPVNPYHPELFKAKCINKNGEEVIVETYAHDMNKMTFDLPVFFAEHISKEICSDIDIDGMKFFRADSKALYEKLKELAESGITIYDKKFYKKP